MFWARSSHLLPRCLDTLLGATAMAISFSDLQDAFSFVSSGGVGEHEAFVDRESGKIYLHSDLADVEDLPQDLDDNDKYLAVPHKNDVDLGTRLVFDFVRQHLPDDYDEVRGSSAAGAPTTATRRCSSGAARSSAGTSSPTRPRRRRCVAGAPRMPSRSTTRVEASSQKRRRPKARSEVAERVIQRPDLRTRRRKRGGSVEDWPITSAAPAIFDRLSARPSAPRKTPPWTALITNNPMMATCMPLFRSSHRPGRPPTPPSLARKSRQRG